MDSKGFLVSFLGGFGSACLARMLVNRGNRKPPQQPSGRRKHLKTMLLGAGSTLLQTTSPLSRFNIYLAGFHPMKSDPFHQVEAHHFCRQVNEDFAQCILFDGNTADANLTGIEYIISEGLFNPLPEEEKQFWHPHNYEILSGQLVAPGIPEVVERELMSHKMNSYGKTWHVWSTGTHGRPGTPLPLGEPMLAWSFNQDGELDADLLRRRDRKLNLDTEERRSKRECLIRRAHLQRGVDVLKSSFPNATPVPGVKDFQPVR